MTTLGGFPIDDITLDAVEHSLGYSLTIDDDGNPVSSGEADYSLHDLLDFLAGCVGDDPNEVWLDAGVVQDTRIHYTEHDLIRALIAEVRRLRGEVNEQSVGMGRTG